MNTLQLASLVVETSRIMGNHDCANEKAWLKTWQHYRLHDQLLEGRNKTRTLLISSTVVHKEATYYQLGPVVLDRVAPIVVQQVRDLAGPLAIIVIVQPNDTRQSLPCPRKLGTFTP